MAVLNILPALQRFNIKSAGIPLGSLQSGVFKPHPALALSNHLHYDKKIDLDKNEALQYLAGNTLPNHNNAKGIHLISFQGHPLGWVNAIQGRLNNLYPHEWRIRLKQ
jgi:NOL1/NOP2/fmu family ribosome biogenesis protein